ETGRFRGHLESQNVPIECQQVIQVFAPDRCSAQPCDHRGGPSWRPVSAVWSNGTPFDARNWPVVHGEEHPTSIALVHLDSCDMRTVTHPAVILPRNHASTLEASRLESVPDWPPGSSMKSASKTEAQE